MNLKIPKRKSDPIRWYSPTFTKLQPNSKVIYWYLIDNCDWAGFVELKKDWMCSFTNMNESDMMASLIELQEEDYISICKGWIFILDFLEEQGNSNLSLKNKAHKPIIERLKFGYSWFKDDHKTQAKLAPYKGLI